MGYPRGMKHVYFHEKSFADKGLVLFLNVNGKFPDGKLSPQRVGPILAVACGSANPFVGCFHPVSPAGHAA
jgi:hypothetical protein